MHASGYSLAIVTKCSCNISLSIWIIQKPPSKYPVSTLSQLLCLFTFYLFKPRQHRHHRRYHLSYRECMHFAVTLCPATCFTLRHRIDSRYLGWTDLILIPQILTIYTPSVAVLPVAYSGRANYSTNERNIHPPCSTSLPLSWVGSGPYREQPEKVNLSIHIHTHTHSHPYTREMWKKLI